MTNKRRYKRYAGVRQRGECSFEINYYVNGKRYSETIKANTEAEAYAIRLQRMATAGLRSIERIAAGVSLKAAIDYYLSQTEKILQAKTRQRSKCIFNHLADFLRQKYSTVTLVNQVTADIGNRYKEYLLSLKDKSPSGINTDISKLRAIFKLFKEYGFISENPFKKVEKIPQRLARPEKKHLPTDYEIKTILNAVVGDPSYEELTMFLVRVGRRIEEATLYEKSDVLLDDKKMPIKIVVRPEITKTKDMGEVPMDDELAGIVKRALNKHPEQKCLFTNFAQRKICSNTYRDFLKRVCERYNLSEISPHCFRYFVVNRLLNSGINLKDAMAVTGHVDIESFMSYVKTTEEGRQKALAITKLAVL
ncbi:MAG: tyrosine-type recombinase/integrase [Candidatus Omnitrophica bacterium]|nr:tyrosine-type recombinase/integrase [Candidatus Omnitrophota bacterium]